MGGVQVTAFIGSAPPGENPDGADPIEQFYTRHPYPPPVDNLDRARDDWRNSGRHRAEFHLFWPDRPYRGDLDILVAGCGTWQAARYAITHPEARVVGIDVSTTSLEHTDRLRRRYSLTNLELKQEPIENAAALSRDFDLIVCTGVLHHLRDPEAGLRALRAVLRPEGALSLMVYGRHARVGLELLQAYCRRLSIGTTEREIADLVATLVSMPGNHPAAGLLHEARDSGDADAIADALLNPRERSYSVPELFDALDRNGCTFGRWYMQAPYLPSCGALAGTPHAKLLANLAEREQYAAVELWRGSLTQHSLILHRDTDGPRRRGASECSVPIRRPFTLCLEERLPPGAAAVLLNKSHPHPDLILPVKRNEKQIYDAIDGSRSIAAVARHLNAPTAQVAAFANTLERYDQVVFDNSSVT